MLKSLGAFGRYTKISCKSYKQTQIKDCVLSVVSLRCMMSGESASVGLNSVAKSGVDLRDVVKVLTDYAPLSLAESWDNVGLLIEPYTKRAVKRIMLTNDLVEKVMQECIEKEVDMIVSYHPPIFTAVKRVTGKSWTERVMQCCLEKGIAVYSPHTSWDSVPGGISDWLASAFDYVPNLPLEQHYSHQPKGHTHSIHLYYEDTDSTTNTLEEELAKLGLVKSNRFTMESTTKFVGNCEKSNLAQLRHHLDKANILSYEVYNSVPIPIANTGAGRLCKFRKPITIQEAVDRIKVRTGVKMCRIAYGKSHCPTSLVTSAAVVPGSGGKVLQSVKADLYVTGEMLHHDVLAAVYNNSTVIMMTHSDSERGFLKVFAETLDSKLDNKVQVLISTSDRDPIELV